MYPSISFKFFEETNYLRVEYARRVGISWSITSDMTADGHQMQVAIVRVTLTMITQAPKRWKLNRSRRARRHPRNDRLHAIR